MVYRPAVQITVTLHARSYSVDVVATDNRNLIVSTRHGHRYGVTLDLDSIDLAAVMRAVEDAVQVQQAKLPF